jgi:hypothetical protein
MPREPLSTGMSDKVWNKVNSLKLEKILLPLKRTTKKLELKPLKDKEKKKVDSFINIHFIPNSVFKFKYKFKEKFI